MRACGASVFERTGRTRLPVLECTTMNERQWPGRAEPKDTSRLM